MITAPVEETRTTDNERSGQVLASQIFRGLRHRQRANDVHFSQSIIFYKVWKWSPSSHDGHDSNNWRRSGWGIYKSDATKEGDPPSTKPTSTSVWIRNQCVPWLTYTHRTSLAFISETRRRHIRKIHFVTRKNIIENIWKLVEDTTHSRGATGNIYGTTTVAVFLNWKVS